MSMGRLLKGKIFITVRDGSTFNDRKILFHWKKGKGGRETSLQRLIRNNLSKQAIYKDKHGIECDWLGTIDKLYSCLSKGIGCELWTLKVRKVFWLADWLVMGIEDIRKKLHNSKLFPEHRDPCRPIFALVTRAPRRKRRKST